VDEAGRRLLLAAAVQGFECDTAVLARALGTDPAETEERLDALERIHAFLRRMREEELPDGTLTLRYRFVHVLYQDALYGSLTPARRAHLSAAVAGALLHHFRERSGAVASQLAFLFEAARDYHESAQLETAVTMAEEALTVAGRLGRPTLVVDAHHAVSMPLTYLGRLTEARKHLIEGVRLYVPEKDRAYGALYHAIDPGVGCRYQSARSDWLLGYPDQAVAHGAEGLALAHKLGHDYSVAQIHVAAAFVHQTRWHDVRWNRSSPPPSSTAAGVWGSLWRW